MDASGQPHVTDFGLAKRFDRDSSLTMSGQVLGSPSYMPPEQAGAGKGKIGPPTDVYALGAMLYHLLTGRPPFVGESLSETLEHVFHREPLSPRLLNAGAPRDLETICLKCLEKEPARRYQNARDLADDLDRFLQNKPIHARPISAPEKAWRWCRRKPAVAGLILLLHLVGAAGLAGILWQAHRKEVQRVEAQQDLYVANVHRANDAMNGHNLDSAQHFLRAIEQSPAQRAMHEWAWRHVMQRTWSDEIGTLGRHDSWLGDLAVSPDQRRCATISEDGMAKLWDLVAGREITSWRAHKIPEHQPDWQYHAVVFTPDGSTLITAGRDAAVRFWDLTALRLGGAPSETHRITGLSTAVNRLAISRDGNLLAGQGFQRSVYVWRLTNSSPSLLVEFKFGAAALVPSGLAFSPDEKTLLVGWIEKPILRCELSPADDSREPQPLVGTSPPLAFSPDGQWLVTAGRSRHVVRLWRWPEPKPLPEFEAEVQGGGAHAFAFSPDSRLLAAGLEGGQLNTWDLTNRAPAVLHGHEEFVDGVAFWQSSNGLKLISASWDKTVRLWEPARARCEEIVLPVRAPALAVAISPDGSYLATVVRTWVAPSEKTPSPPFELQLWDFKTRRLRKAVLFGGENLSPVVAFSPDSKLLAATDYSPLQFYKVPSLELEQTTGNRGQVFASHGTWLAYIDRKGIIKRESLEAPEQVLVPGRGDLQQLALSPDDRIVAGSEQVGAKIWLWDARDGHLLRPALSGHTGRIVALGFTPDSRTLVSCDWEGQLGIWDVKSGDNLAFLRGHNNAFNWAVLSPDGGTIATGGDDSVVRLWNVARRQEIAVLQGHADNVNSLAFSPDGQWLASASDDGTIRLWRAPSVEEIAKSQTTE
jgi:WD40 repeat protein